MIYVELAKKKNTIMQLILESVLKIKPKKTYFLSNPNSLYIKLHILIFNNVLDFLLGEILTAFFAISMKLLDILVR